MSPRLYSTTPLGATAMVLAAVVMASSVRAGGRAGNQGVMEPNPPRDIKIKDVTSTTVEIDWRRPSRGGEDGYIVYRDGKEIAVTESSQYTDEGLQPFTTYSYWVTAFDDDGDESDPSETVQATTLDDTPPTAPADLVATASQGPRVDLTWTPSNDPESGVAEYRVFRDGSEIGTSQTTSFADTEVGSGTFEYTVSAVNGQGLESPLSDPASAATPDETAPTIPADLSAAAVGPKRIDLAWTPSDDPESGVAFYRIARDGFEIATVTETSYADADLMPETSYSYTVSAVNGEGLESGPSDAASATTLEGSEGPPPPPQVSATAISATQVNVSWTPPDVPDGDVSGYNVYRDGAFVGSIMGTSFADIGLSPGTTYAYTVSSFNADGLEGERSAAATATTPTVGGDVPPAPPSGLRVVSS